MVAVGVHREPAGAGRADLAIRRDGARERDDFDELALRVTIGIGQREQQRVAVCESRIHRAAEQRVLDRTIVETHHRHEAVDVVQRLPHSGRRRAVEKIRLGKMLAAMLQRAHAGLRDLLGTHERHAAGRRAELGQRDAVTERELVLEFERDRAELDLLRRQRETRADDLLVGQRNQLRDRMAQDLQRFEPLCCIDAHAVDLAQPIEQELGGRVEVRERQRRHPQPERTRVRRERARRRRVALGSPAKQSAVAFVHSLELYGRRHMPAGIAAQERRKPQSIVFRGQSRDKDRGWRRSYKGCVQNG